MLMLSKGEHAELLDMDKFKITVTYCTCGLAHYWRSDVEGSKEYICACGRRYNNCIVPELVNTVDTVDNEWCQGSYAQGVFLCDSAGGLLYCCPACSREFYHYPAQPEITQVNPVFVIPLHSVKSTA